jgi:surface antigen
LKTIIIAIVLQVGFIPYPQHAQMSRGTPSESGTRYTNVQLIEPITSISFKEEAPLETIAPPSLPVSPQGTYVNTYEWGNCTWYVAGRKAVPNSWGNADTWAGRAAASGITVSALPILGAIAQSTGGVYGHVAIVVGMGDGTVTVQEMNVYGLGQVDQSTYPVSHFNNYIYF